LGASRFLIVRQLLVESLVLALAGGAVGLGLGFGGTALFAATIPQHNYRVGAIEVDAMVMIFAAVLSLTTGLLFGLAPAFTAWRDDVVAALKEGGRQSDGRSSQGMRRGLVVTQVALAVVLLTGAFITAGQFREMLRARWGFQTERLLVAPLPLPLDRYTNAARFVSFQEQLRARLRALPGVEAAAISTALPLAGERDTAREFQIEGPSVALRAMAGGRPAFPGTEGRGGPVAWLEWISPDYFETLGVPRLSGRDFNAAEVSTGGNVALINRHLAENYFQNQNPVGRRLRLLAPASGQAGPKQEQLLEIIGVTGDVRHGYPTEKARPWVYLPYAQNPDWNIALAVRTTLAPETVAGAVRAAVAALDPQLPAVSVRTMPSYIRQSMADERVQTVLWTLFAAAALMLAVIGLYGLLSFTVAHGTRDLAIRMALGASRGCVLRQVMFGGMQLTAAGLGLGLTISWIGWRLVSSYWFIAAPLEAWPVASVMVTLPLAALVACIFPARRATRIQPAEALRRG
jgi:putative ABC transport system permease protein